MSQPSRRPLALVGSGMVTAVGLDAPSACAAIRCAINNFTETRFMDSGGEWIIGSQVPLEQPWRGVPKLLHMIVPAIRECLEQAQEIDYLVRPERIGLLLCLAEKDRPGRLPGLDADFLRSVEAELGVRFHSTSGVLAKGRIAGALALLEARRLLYEERLSFVLIAGVDSFLIASTLAAYEKADRLLTSQNSNGFIPGEGAAAVLVGLPGATKHADDLLCTGIGLGHEGATITSELPLRADGLVQAFRAALADAQVNLADLDFRITDLNGEQYMFKEAALALTRTLRARKEIVELWHAADCIGEVGAAAAPAALAVALAAARKGYTAGRGPLCHFSSDDGQRIALVLQSADVAPYALPLQAARANTRTPYQADYGYGARSY